MINGITNKDVMRAPKWPTLYDKVRIILEGRLVIAYNSAFDRVWFVKLTRNTDLPKSMLPGSAP